MDRFYHSALDSNDLQITLSVSESQHMARVLRKKTGAAIEIFNGNGGIAKGEILTVDPKGCRLQIHDYSKALPPSYFLHIGIAPTKSNDRFEWFLEKATEIGIQRITPLLCDNSERRKINIERWQKILVSAAKQSRQAYLPQLDPLTPFTDLINSQNQILIAHCQDSPKVELYTIPVTTDPTCILIGPEGDFSMAEIDQVEGQGAQAIQLGTNRLRTETAGLVACQSWRLLHDISQQ